MTVRAIVFHDANVAIGVACRLMIGRPAFEKQLFGPWIAVIAAQADRGHMRFFIDGSNRVVGFFGYALARKQDAEAWAFRDTILENKACCSGECVLFNVWVSDEKAARRVMLNEARRASRGQKMAYFKRFYPNGQIRVTRLRIRD